MDFAYPSEPTVPDWAAGCWHRGWIRYAGGAEDAATRVVWVQSANWFGDMRVPAERPAMSERGGLADLTFEELQALALQQGSFGVCRIAGTVATWPRAIGFAPIVHFPEPGLLARRGAIMMETAPSGAYVEEWRHQPGSGACLAAFQAEAEAGAPRRFVVVAGDHAFLVRDRRLVFERAAPLEELILAHRHDRALIEAMLDCEFAYARRDAPGGPFTIRLSTLPFREGRPVAVPSLDPERPPPALVTLGHGVEAERWRCLSWRAVPAAA